MNMRKILLIVILLFAWTQGNCSCLSDDSFSNISYKSAVGELLQSDEVFIQFRGVYTGTYEYAAIIVDSNADNSVVRYLFDSHDLHQYVREDCTNIDLGKLVWGTLSDVLKDKTNVYFSASGELYNYPIEYLPNPENPEKQMNEDYKMYRLSGIEQIARQKTKTSKKQKAVVFGGLEYDLNVDADYTSDEKLLAFRGALQPELPTLPETKKEVAYIDSLLRRKNILVSLQTGKSGGKKAFNEVAESNATLLHLATHGFYNPDFYQTDENQLKKWMMSRTGICLAGDYNTNASKDDNGLVTGKDISSLDMENLDLVVLSACQTGLGDVFEGKQYGLSAAFKDADVKSILASLWSVEDNATKILMIRFYSNLLKGMDKIDALKDAQAFVRNFKPKRKTKNGDVSYQDSKFWAAFIMVDANKPHETPVSQEALDFIRKFQDENMLGSIVEQDVENWNKYKDLLNPDDALIYFYNYTLPSGEDEYVALIYTNEYINGVLVPVCRNKEKIVGWEQWQGLSDSVYLKLGPYIKDMFRVMFRPTGMLELIPIETLWEDTHPNCCFYRISSGESLKMLSEQQTAPKSALLVGGLDYSYDKNAVEKSMIRRFYRTTGSIQTIFSPLPDTKREVEDIDSFLRPIINNVVLLKDKYGTEKILTNNLIAKQFNILHFATHGGHFALKSVLSLTPQFIMKSYSSLKENLMAFNYIALSGANNIIEGEKSIGNENLLSALEVSKMDLRDVDLVVLSTAESLFSASTSCQSFGMAYGFKQAGVKSILATIWKIDDTATQMIMIEFYKQWIYGKSKHDALKEAQEYLRNVDNGKYSDPMYWAAFILLDAID